MAWLNGRDYVLPEDVRTVFPQVIAHRLLLSPEAEAQGVSADKLLQEILKKNAAPRLG